MLTMTTVLILGFLGGLTVLVLMAGAGMLGRKPKRRLDETPKHYYHQN